MPAGSKLCAGNSLTANGEEKNCDGCIYVFCVDLRTNNDYFPIQH